MSGRRILVIEDEFLIALDITGALEDAGFTVVGPAGTISEALTAVEKGDFDVALLDANLSGHPVGDVADALKAKAAPFAFVTGYGRDHLPAAHRQAPLVKKPFSSRDLLQVVDEL